MSSSYYSTGREESPFSGTRQIPRYTRTTSDRTMDSADVTDRRPSGVSNSSSVGTATATSTGIAPRLHIRTQQGRPPVVHMELSFNGKLSKSFIHWNEA